MSHDSALNLYATYAQHFPDPSNTLLSTGDGRVFTYADAEARSAQVANFLVSRGLKAGDRVTVQVQKSPENLWLFLGVIRAGMVFHPLNTAYTESELAFFIADAEPSMVVCDSSNHGVLRKLCEQAGTEALYTLNADGSGSLADNIADCSSEFTTAKTQADDLAALVYSSGTTGQPKGIMLSHGNLVANAAVLVDYWGFSSHDCLLHALPIFHVHGLFVAIGCVLMSGASMRWLPGFDVEATLKQLPRSTVMMGVPTYYTRLLAEPAFDSAVVSHMRLFISGSAPLLPETFTEFEQRTGHTILERYGMTETGMNTSNPLNGLRKVGTVGPALPGTDVRICNAENERLPTGEIGDVQVRGPNVFSGYWRLPAKTAQEFTPDGYLVTGDKGQLDTDGYLSIVGRSKDMVITGGLNVYPREIELIIDELPGVLESAVIGLADADFGESVAAVIVKDGTREIEESAVRDGLRGNLAGFKVPKRVFFAEELPRNTMGKVRKDLLRKTYS